MDTNTDPETTFRQLYQGNLDMLETQLFELDELIASAGAIAPTIDSATAQCISQALSGYRNVRQAIDSRRVAVANAIRGWDGLEPLPAAGIFTPTLPTYTPTAA